MNVEIRGECQALIWATKKDGSTAHACSRRCCPESDFTFCTQHYKKWSQPVKMMRQRGASQDPEVCSDCTSTQGRLIKHQHLYEHFGTVDEPTNHFLRCYEEAVGSRYTEEIIRVL